MSPTKTQILEELKSIVDEETYQALVTDFQDLPEQLSQQDMVKVDEILAELEEAEKISAHVLGQLADAAGKAADDLTDAADEFVESAAKTTYDNAKLAKDLME